MKSDLELVEEVRAGNRVAFSELVRRHQRGLLRLVVRFTKDLDSAEDVVQDSFVKAYQKLSMFEGRSSFKSWLYRIAINTAKNKLRQDGGEDLNIDDVRIAVRPDAESDLTQGSIKETLYEEVQKLPEKQRTALVLRVYEDLSFKEISQIMECPYDTAKANYRHALIKLREMIAKKHDLKDLKEFDDQFVLYEEVVITKVEQQ